MRFYLDADLSPTIARVARDLGLDVVSSHDAGNDHLPDEAQLDVAAGGGRCLVTGNDRDFRRLTERFAAEGRRHEGVLCVPPTWHRGNYSRIARALVAYAAQRGEVSNEFLYDFLR